jgi:hypothetical protein
MMMMGHLPVLFARRIKCSQGQHLGQTTPLPLCGHQQNDPKMRQEEEAEEVFLL